MVFFLFPLIGSGLKPASTAASYHGINAVVNRKKRRSTL